MVRELQSLAIRTAGDVPRYPKVFWERRFGKAGITLYERAQGIDPREVEPYTPPKSESAETTFDIDTRDIGFLKSWLFPPCGSDRAHLTETKASGPRDHAQNQICRFSDHDPQGHA